MVLDLRATTIAYPGYKTHWGIEHHLYSAQGNDLQHSRKADKIDRSGFGTRVRNSEPGMMDGSLKIKGLATMDKGTLNWQLNQWFGRKSPVNAWYALEGLDALSPITMQPSSIVDASISSKLKDAVDFDLELDARGAFDDGVILLSPEDLLIGASGTGVEDVNLNFGGLTRTGGAAQLHVWALDGGSSPSVQVTVQHSPDSNTWTDLIVFDTFDAVGSQRIDLPYPTLVNQYVQAIWETDGNPTAVQVLLGFARGVDLDV